MPIIFKQQKIPSVSMYSTIPPQGWTSLTPRDISEKNRIMPRRNLVFANEEIYHVYNRGIDKKEIFKTRRDYGRAEEIIDFYRFEKMPLRFSHYDRLTDEEKNKFYLTNSVILDPRVEILCYCLMPNHFHLLLRQKQEGGIAGFISNFQNSHSKYFDLKHERTGPLFQPMFHAVHIEDDRQLMHISRYIHLNPATAYLIEGNRLEEYPWSSYNSYAYDNEKSFVSTDIIMSLFKDKDEYRKFVLDFVNYERQLAAIKHLILE